MLKLVVDSREQAPLDFTGYDCTVERGSLPTGDYSVAGLTDRVAVERKSLDDLIGCLMGDNRDRFERELARARGYDFFAVVVEAAWEHLARGQYRSRMKPHSAAQSVVAFQVRYGVPFLFAGTRKAAAYLTLSLLEKYVSEQQARLVALLKASTAA